MKQEQQILTDLHSIHSITIIWN